MKRAKILLTAIGVFTIIGGALAFKAYRGVSTFCRVGGPGICTRSYINTSFITTNSGSLYCTFNSAEACTARATLFQWP